MSPQRLPLAARRTFRLAASVAIALAIAYGSGLMLPYLAPLLAFFLGAQPSTPMAPGKLAVIALALAVILGVGLVVAPLLEAYPPVGLGVVAVGLLVSSRISISGKKAAVGTLLAAGLTLVSAVGVLSLAVAQVLIISLVAAVVIAVLSQWLVWPLFPEGSNELSTSADVSLPVEEGTGAAAQAFRAMLITFPAYLFLLTNPTGNTPVMMKSIVLAQTGTVSNARLAARELLGATALGGVFAVSLWFALKLAPNLLFFSLWTLLLVIGVGRRLYQPGASRFSSQFWADVTVTALILLGGAVEDSATGRDPYQAFAFRFGFFVLVSVYAVVAHRLVDVFLPKHGPNISTEELA